LIRQVMATLVMTVAVFTFILLLGNVLKEVLGLLVNSQVGLATVMQTVVLLVPFVLVFALPMGFLTATLLVFGRLSADQELTALRASGVSLVSLITPVLVLSLLFCGLSAFINLQVAPQCRMKYRAILKEAGLKQVTQSLPEKTFIRDFKGYIVYIGEVKGTNLNDLHIYELGEDGTLSSYYKAITAEIYVDRAKDTMNVKLENVWRIGMWQGQLNPAWAGKLPLEVSLDQEKTRKRSLGDMTASQLMQELEDLQAMMGEAIPLESGRANEKDRKKSLKYDMTMPVKVQLHRQVSFSFACLGFTLVGIPLGIRAHRRETTFGIVAALGLVFLYYSFFIIGQALETRPEWGPHLILWLPNIVFQSVGMVLLWKANQQG